MFHIMEIIARPIDGGPSSDFRVEEAKKEKSCFYLLGCGRAAEMCKHDEEIQQTSRTSYEKKQCWCRNQQRLHWMPIDPCHYVLAEAH